MTVESYLRSVGIRGYQPRKAFWERLTAKHGPIAKKVADAISAREEGHDVDVYSLKNNTLSLSIDVTSQYHNQMYSEFLSWFLRRKFPKPKSLLDVGCDNGILSCFYAMLYPEAEVVGIDRCERGIACACQLASMLELTNIRFEVRDLLNLEEASPDQSFDLIVSTAVFHEVLNFPEEFPEGRSGSIEGKKDELEDSVRIVADLAKLLEGQVGTFVSMERWGDAASLAWWIRVLNRAGLDVEQSHLLRFYDMDGERERLPILLATRNEHRTL